MIDLDEARAYIASLDNYERDCCEEHGGVDGFKVCMKPERDMIAALLAEVERLQKPLFSVENLSALRREIADWYVHCEFQKNKSWVEVTPQMLIGRRYPPEVLRLCAIARGLLVAVEAQAGLRNLVEVEP